MNRAQLFLWSLLQSCEHVDDSVLSDLADQAAGEWPLVDKEQRRADMEAAIGAWTEREDLPDSYTYLAGLRDEVRAEWPVAV